MSKNPKYPIKNLSLPSGDISVPHFRTRVIYENYDEYEIIDSDILKDEANLFASLADKFYGDANLWVIIADNNPLIRDNYIYSGTTIRIPILN